MVKLIQILLIFCSVLVVEIKKEVIRLKKVCLFLSSVLTVVALTACGSSSNDANQDVRNKTSSNNLPQTKAKSQVGDFGKTLVVYFSQPETTNPDNMTQEEENSTVVIDGKVLGNTQYVAQVIQAKTKGDLFRIEPEKAYPTDHDQLVDLAKEEQTANARPKLAKTVDDIEQYETIFLGYPNWWGDLPMVLYSFLEATDLSGKNVIPFNTHGGSVFSDTINTIKKEAPAANVIDAGYSVSRDDVKDSKKEIETWVDSLK